MNIFKKIATVVLVTFCFSSVIVMAQVNWDFEDGKDHGFSLWCVNPATPAADDPDIAGDEAITGVGGTDGLPDAGVAWSVGPPYQYDGFVPAVEEGCHVVGGVLAYGPCNNPFGEGALYGEPNERGQFSYLNTYNLSQWGDDLHSASNDQIATSPPVELSNDAKLIVWSLGGGSGTAAPELETDPNDGYWEGSSGIAVLSAQDRLFRASVYTQNKSTYGADTLDLSDFAGQTVIIEAVDAFQGSWGWLAVDMIEITNATLVATAVEEKSSTVPSRFELAQNFPNPFNPTTRIQYTLGKNTKVEITVFDLLGRKVTTLLNAYQNAGSHRVIWDASGASAGVYLYQMKVENQIFTKKMVLLK